jgi:hypothetical protein
MALGKPLLVEGRSLTGGRMDAGGKAAGQPH